LKSNHDIAIDIFHLDIYLKIILPLLSFKLNINLFFKKTKIAITLAINFQLNRCWIIIVTLSPIKIKNVLKSSIDISQQVIIH